MAPTNEITRPTGSPAGTIGVVGAGVMGRGLAQVLAEAGYNVVLTDISQPILEAAREDIARSIKLAMLMRRGPKTARPNEILGGIHATADIGLLNSADFIIENTTEDWSIKQSVFSDLDRIANPDCVIAANTSAIPIAKLASLLSNSSRVIGMHFMNPVPQKELVEVIRGPATSQATIDAAFGLLHGIGKQAVLVNDSPGFVTNRVLMLTINEAIAVVREGVASAADTDRIFVGCFAHAMGPLATADLIGLDTIKRSLDVLQDCFGDTRFAPDPLLVDMVSAGHLGRKSGKGFFDYLVKGNADGRPENN